MEWLLATARDFVGLGLMALAIGASVGLSVYALQNAFTRWEAEDAEEEDSYLDAESRGTLTTPKE